MGSAPHKDPRGEASMCEAAEPRPDVPRPREGSGLSMFWGGGHHQNPKLLQVRVSPIGHCVLLGMKGSHSCPPARRPGPALPRMWP